MQGVLLLISLLLLISPLPEIHGLCRLMRDKQTRCHELEDIKYIDAQNIESLRTSVMNDVLNPTLLKNLSALKHLDLSGGKLKKIESGDLEGLINLKSLDLANNQIDSLALDSVENLNQLRSLNLRANNLKSLPLALTRLKKLQHLDIHGNPLQCNCASLQIRDSLIVKGVKISKKVICAGPSSMKSIQLLKPDTKGVCAFEIGDGELQGDQPAESSGEGSGHLFNDFDEDNEEFEMTEDFTATENVEIETPFSENTGISTVDAISSPGAVIIPTSASTVLEKRTDETELFFDSIGKKTIMTPVTERKLIKDALFYPVEGSSDEESSGEGSGIGVMDLPSNNDEGSNHQETDTVSSTSSGANLYDILFGGWWGTTSAPKPGMDLNLEEEEFINVPSAKSPINEDIIAPRVINDIGSETSVSDPTTSTTVRSFEFVNTTGVTTNDSRTGQVEVEIHKELAEMSPAIQSQRGMGSYVVLAVLLTILMGLIGLAAYKGDFCRKKKKKRCDMENGTELKDLQKSLLEVNITIQPKIASNGSTEMRPLVNGPPEQDPSGQNVESADTDTLKSSNGTSQWNRPDVVKPSKKIIHPHTGNTSHVPSDRIPTSNSYTPERSTEDSPHASTKRPSVEDRKSPSPNFHEILIPPSSPRAHRVKITLQDNPDSVPKTPILITKTIIGEELVKMP